MKRILYSAVCSALAMSCAGSALAAAYKIPEQSINSTALAAAYVANARGADAAYFNPAAMSFNADRSMLEADLTGIHLTGIEYDGPSADKTKSENFLVPTFHYVSPAVGKARFGLSVVAPAGLSKRWRGPLKASAEEFTLKTIEINPTISYLLTDQLSVAAGLRGMYSEGTVKSTAGISRNLSGDSIDWGYNLAVLFKPIDRLSLAATYRSRVTLTVDGNAELMLGTTTAYDDDANVELPVPAALNLAAAFDVTPRTNVEIVWERTYWSDYKKLDFNYNVNLTSIHAALATFDNPIPKDWDDSDTLRLGLTHKYDDRWTLMAGLAFDETPVPEATLGTELPDSDAVIVSAGARYRYSDQISLGGAVLYDRKESRQVSSPPNISTLNGEFDNARAWLVTVGMEYLF